MPYFKSNSWWLFLTISVYEQSLFCLSSFGVFCFLLKLFYETVQLNFLGGNLEFKRFFLKKNQKILCTVSPLHIVYFTCYWNFVPVFLLYTLYCTQCCTPHIVHNGNTIPCCFHCTLDICSVYDMLHVINTLQLIIKVIFLITS